MRKLICLALLAVSCKSQITTTSDSNNDETETLNITTNVTELPRTDEIPVGNAAIIGLIKKITPPNESLAFPCSEYPCKAIVIVENILGYGHSFAGTLSADQEIEVNFRLSLSPTKDVFPDKKENLPGLKEGDRLQANVSSQIGRNNQVSYEIVRYTKK